MSYIFFCFYCSKKPRLLQPDSDRLVFLILQDININDFASVHLKKIMFFHVFCFKQFYYLSCFLVCLHQPSVSVLMQFDRWCSDNNKIKHFFVLLSGNAFAHSCLIFFQLFFLDRRFGLSA